MPDYATTIKNFRPQFGNMEHIRILENIEKLSKKKKLLKEKKATEATIKKQLKEIEYIERNISYSIELSK